MNDVPHSSRAAYAGRVEQRVITSEVLRGNALGDPHEREVPVYLPPGWDAPGVELPALFVLAGFTGRGQGYLGTHPWRKPLVWQYDELVASGTVPPAILVLPDCFTKLGGSQYVNSSATGRYEDHVVEELVPWVDEHYPTLAGRRAVVGKSSGGFGALHLAMRHPELFPVAASVSGDCQFEYTFQSEMLAALRGLVPHGGDPAAFLRSFEEDPELSHDGHAVINVLAMAACYSPNPASSLGFDLPMDLETGERIEEVWQRWLAFDPVVACERYAANLKRLELLHLECGLMDEYNLQWALRVLAKRLRALDVPFVHEEHPGTHRGLDHRYLKLFPTLTERLAR